MDKRKFPSLEGLVAFVVMLCTVGVVYGSTSTRITSLESKVSEYENRITPILEELRRSTTEIQIAQEGIRKDIIWIKNNLEEEE